MLFYFFIRAVFYCYKAAASSRSGGGGGQKCSSLLRTAATAEHCVPGERRGGGAGRAQLPVAVVAFVSLLSPGRRRHCRVRACDPACVFSTQPWEAAQRRRRRRRRPGFFCFPDVQTENIILLIETRCACAAATTHRDRQLFTKHCFIT